MLISVIIASYLPMDVHESYGIVRLPLEILRLIFDDFLSSLDRTLFCATAKSIANLFPYQKSIKFKDIIVECGANGYVSLLEWFWKDLGRSIFTSSLSLAAISGGQIAILEYISSNY
jgi:hypothetical protein